MKSKLIFFALLISCISQAQDKRALIIGIDHYSPPTGYKPASNAGRIDFPNLDGCRNDALAIKSVIISKYFFPEKNVETLLDEAATRDNILEQIKSLLAKSKKGDIAFLYYAGHGSQQKNSRSLETDKKDESIVPSDTWKENIGDIRDKELARIFNGFIDKEVKLTVIFDCCHSGSLSRGPVYDKPKIRYIAENNYDAKDDSNPTPPEERNGGNFLMIAAAQDNEPACEQYDDNNLPHGAFTIALLNAIQQQPVDISAFNLFTSVRAILKSNGKKQEPVLAGKLGRQQETLFGISKASIPDKSLVAISGKNGNQIILQGGFAVGLNKDNELTKVKGKDSIVIKVDSVLGVNRASALVIHGNINSVNPGDLFEVTNWVSSRAPLLKLYIPKTNFTFEQVLDFAQTDLQLKQSDRVNWINNLEKNDPFLSVFFDGKWYSNIGGKALTELKDIDPKNIIRLNKRDSTLYFDLPPFTDFTNALINTIKKNPSIQIVQNPNDANYILYGTIDDEGKPSYGLRRTQTSSKDSLGSMPLQTKSFVVENGNKEAMELAAVNIYDNTMRLSKIRGWLQLSGPAGTKSRFPYHIVFFNTDLNKQIESYSYKVNDNISLHLVANKGYQSYDGAKKYVYIFGIDKSGSMALIYPSQDDGNQMNQFPKMDGNNNFIKDINIASYQVPEPSGTDNFFLLASDEPLTNYSLIFNQEGVRGMSEPGNGLEALLNMGNNGSRGLPNSLPGTWSLQKVSFKCTH